MKPELLVAPVSIAGVIFSDKPNDKSSPKPNTNTEEELPAMH